MNKLTTLIALTLLVGCGKDSPVVSDSGFPDQGAPDMSTTSGWTVASTTR